jgi:photosystem II stability/assembly factor-like uncharacterized protein
MKIVAVLALVMGCAGASGQFDVEDSHTTANLRGVDSVGAGTVWASGWGGTVLRSEDGGFLWQTCAMPKGAEKLDFRGVQAFDAKTAVVMSSGKGSLSKIYRTTDGCTTWTMVFENPDADGFFDAIKKVTDHQMYVLGDPVDGKFMMFFSPDQGQKWFLADDPGREAGKDVGAFAASNSSLAVSGNAMVFGAGAGAGQEPKVYRTVPKCASGADGQCSIAWEGTVVPMAGGSTSAGVFSVGLRVSMGLSGKPKVTAVAVGGDYAKPTSAAGTAAYSTDGGEHWMAAARAPNGYRSAVQYASNAGAWIAVGPGGTDVSKDDGKTWTAVAGEDSTGWNAVSLPFVVGEKGKIGKLRAGALK